MDYKLKCPYIYGHSCINILGYTYDYLLSAIVSFCMWTVLSLEKCQNIALTKMTKLQKCTVATRAKRVLFLWLTACIIADSQK